MGAAGRRRLVRKQLVYSWTPTLTVAPLKASTRQYNGKRDRASESLGEVEVAGTMKGGEKVGMWETSSEASYIQPS